MATASIRTRCADNILVSPAMDSAMSPCMADLRRIRHHPADPLLSPVNGVDTRFLRDPDDGNARSASSNTVRGTGVWRRLVDAELVVLKASRTTLSDSDDRRSGNRRTWKDRQTSREASRRIRNVVAVGPRCPAANFGDRGCNSDVGGVCSAMCQWPQSWQACGIGCKAK